MKKYLLALATLLLIGCANTNNTVEVEDNDQIAVCGSIDNEKQTYPTLGDLKADGAKFLFYGPCY
jgi:outer membrane biogenesis lipoprotein LolB